VDVAETGEKALELATDVNYDAILLDVRLPGMSGVLDSFGRIVLFLFPISLLLTAGISALYVGRSLAPIAPLTQHATLMAERVTHRQEFWEPPSVRSPHDELGRLAETFNHLFRGVDSAVGQLRQFVTDASHELRTPIAVLHGETELLLSKPRSAEEYRKTLSVFDDEFKKLARIVDGLFTLSMAEAGQLQLQHEPLYINEVLEEACAVVSLRARKRNITITRELDREVPYNGDEAFLHQLFLIFLDNAIKYSADGTEVSVTLEQRDGTIRVCFEDHGIGISANHLAFYLRALLSSGAARKRRLAQRSAGFGDRTSYCAGAERRHRVPQHFGDRIKIYRCSSVGFRG
jgi:signal transduction histidine kinase